MSEANTQNADLVATQAQLGEVLEDLRASIGATTDPEVLKRILIEIAEVTHRITVLGQLIFHARTTAITQAATDVAAATAEVKKAIAAIDKLNAFLGTITKFLGLVDKVIDLAKLI